MSDEPQKINETNEWIFPEMDVFQEDEDALEYVSGEGELEDEEDEEDDALAFDVPHTKATNKKSEAEILLEEKKIECEKKHDTLQSILAKIKDPLAFLDDHIINILQDIIKKIVTKIIYKEISADPELVKKIIEDLKSLIYSQNGLINIFLSEEDFNRVKLSPEETSQPVYIDKALKEGDIIINTKDTEVRALLNDRIELLMGTLHD